MLVFVEKWTLLAATVVRRIASRKLARVPDGRRRDWGRGRDRKKIRFRAEIHPATIAVSDRYACLRASLWLYVCWCTSEGQREVRRKKFDLSLGRVHRLILSVGLRQRDVLHQSPVVLQCSSITVGRMDAGMQNYKTRAGGLVRQETHCRSMSVVPEDFPCPVSVETWCFSEYRVSIVAEK